jgi:drug/metabolite transporter (DMT)-like permease
MGSHRGIVLMVAGMGLFSLSDVMAKRLMSTLPAIEIVWIRYFALALSIVWMIARGAAWPRTTRPAMQIGRGAFLVVSTACYNFGLAFLPLATATALVFSSPLFVIVLSILFLHEHFAPRRWAWPVLGFVGVVIVANPDPATFNPAALFPFAASILWAAAMVMTRRIATTDSAFAIQAWSSGVAVLLLTLVLPFVFVLPSLAQLPEIIVMAVLWAVAQWFVIHAYHASEASDVAPFAYSQLVWASLFSTVLLSQIPDLRTLTGVALILIAGAGAALATRRPPAAG